MKVRLSDLALRLRVPNEQDWGICAGDPARLEEFLNFVQENKELHDDYWVGVELFDLVFSSMCPLHEANPEEEVLVSSLAILQDLVARFPGRYEYWQEFWSDLEQEDGEPVKIRHRLRVLLQNVES